MLALWQLVDLGLSASAVRHRVAAGRWHRLYAGACDTGHAPLARDGRHMAAVLACGRGHRGIDAHSNRTLLERGVSTVDAIPCTSVARTLLDLAAVLARRAVVRFTWRRQVVGEQAVVAATVERMLDPA